MEVASPLRPFTASRSALLRVTVIMLLLIVEAVLVESTCCIDSPTPC